MGPLFNFQFATRRSRWTCALLPACLLLLLAARSHGAESGPFTFSPAVVISNDVRILSVAIHVPEQHHIYAERLSFELDGVSVDFHLPAARRVADRFSDESRLVYEQDFRAWCTIPRSDQDALTFAINFQGCSESECYFPEMRRWKIKADNSVATVTDETAGAAAVEGTLTNGFRVAVRASGFVSSGKFLRLLDASREGAAPLTDDLASRFSRIGATATLGLILLGGLALNLTPCVLPMIPINLAILGAGTRQQNRRRGFALGAAYGSGMAIVYGSLGLIVVMTGSKFGALNASPWFNFVIASVFVALGLAMFDKLAIDFSRFQNTGGKSGFAGGAFVGAGLMGALSALLAGACVAPVVISVLLLATTLYQNGNVLGLLLPFALGIGMAIPWPFAGAGLSCLPKPGAWMTRVKYAFGVIILGFAMWYGWLGVNLARAGRDGGQLASARSDSVRQLRSALDQSRANGRPVVIDFWASWCKNCEAMEHTTFRDATVRERLTREFFFVKFQAEQLNDPELKPVLDQFGVMGLPTYVVVVPDRPAAPRGL